MTEIVLTKADRLDDLRPLVEEIEAAAVGVPTRVVSASTGQGSDGLRVRIQPARTVPLGSSGVGVRREARLRKNEMRAGG